MGFQYKYIIVDDDELSRLSVEAEAEKYGFLHKTASCGNALEAKEIISACNPDIVFADIEMPGISGIELIKSLSVMRIAPVFITSHPEFALESYELEAFDYLLKPVNAERFEKCAFRLRDFFELRENAFSFTQEQELNSIIIKQGYDKYKLPVGEILYLEAMKDYTKIITEKKNYLVLETITGMHNKLPNEKFIRVHRSYVVNKEKIEIAKPNAIKIGSHELPIGKMYKSVLAKHLY
ncbi:MAG: response regulator transcription factor [Bacteroidetes bacterium]|nr:response regulator transcription factor [Bacteroidota bacterium]